jgi:hypothetical protein
MDKLLQEKLESTDEEEELQLQRLSKTSPEEFKTASNFPEDHPLDNSKDAVYKRIDQDEQIADFFYKSSLKKLMIKHWKIFTHQRIQRYTQQVIHFQLI